jgi:peptidoglycan/xylan/chitin deacetylase (PgdA/CDA1 family)
MKALLSLVCSICILLLSCQNSGAKKQINAGKIDSTAQPVFQKDIKVEMADAATILARKQVPILCYHQIRDWKATDSKVARDYIVPPANFESQIKMLHDSGYTTILPDQLYDYLAYGKAIPEKAVMLTFDDTDLSQYETAVPVLDKYGYKAAYFIMTVSINRPRYMSREQIKELSDKGNAIGSHTWDHQNVKKLKGDDWITQVEKPSKKLEEITGKKIDQFAYPFGLWNKEAIPELKKRGIKAAYQLVEPRDSTEPLYTIRRMIVPGSWDGAKLHKMMKSNFKL